MKIIRKFGQIEKRESGKYRARVGDPKKNLGTFDTYEQAEQAIEEYKIKNNIVIDESIDEESNMQSKPFAEIGLDGVNLSTGVLDSPLTNWDNILLSFGLDPTEFEVDEDKVRMSKWQSSKRLENGDRDLIWLYSYRATFKRRSRPKLTDKDFIDLRNLIKQRPKKEKNKPKQNDASFVILWADWQLAKSASGGLPATIARIKKSFEKTHERINELKKAGRQIKEIVFVNMGDPIESCDGHYASQLFTVQATQRQQLLLALDLWTIGIDNLADLAPKTKFIGTLSNHGEWQRRNGKSITSDSDSADGFLADALHRVLDGKNLINDWHIPHDEMSMQVNLSGIECAFTHGHKIQGKELEWLRAQSIRLLRDNGAEPRIWFTAHKHHTSVIDYGAFTRFQCPSLDTDGSTSGGSKWFTDASGIWSSPGTMTLLVGQHDKRGWSDLAIL